MDIWQIAIWPIDIRQIAIRTIDIWSTQYIADAAMTTLAKYLIEHFLSVNCLSAKWFLTLRRGALKLNILMMMKTVVFIIIFLQQNGKVVARDHHQLDMSSGARTFSRMTLRRMVINGWQQNEHM